MKLGTKLIAFLVTSVIITMAVHGYLSVKQDKDNVLREIRVGMRGLSRAVQVALSDLYGDDQNAKAAQEFIDKVGGRGNIHGLVVYNRSGEPIMVSASLKDTRDFPAFDPEPVLKIDPSPVLHDNSSFDGYIQTQRQLIYYRMEPILDSNGKLMGAVVLARQGYGWGLARNVETRRNRIIYTTSTLAVILSVLILLLVRRHIARPINELIVRIRATGKGHWEQRIEVPGQDEVSSLAQEFNRMCERLQETYSKLVKEQEEKLQLERSLRQSEKLASVGQLAAGLAHEIGTPLNIIGGRAEYLLRRPRGSEETSENLKIIRTQIDRIAGIVRQLLEFSRRKEPSFRSVDIASLLTNVQTLMEHKLREKGVKVNFALFQPLPTIRADPDLLQQVLINLYLNSVQALGFGGTIDVKVEATENVNPEPTGASMGRKLRLSFEDNGPGIATEHVERIFDPFFTTKDIGEGTGLGLSVSYGIIKDHGGEIRVESDPGHFTRFIIDLPVPLTESHSEKQRIEV